MSAIFGIIGKNNQPINQNWIASMLKSLRHRGPDGAHQWQNDSVVVGHLMMHTTPESCFDRQPLEYRHWVVVADVRLDNRKELFDLLGIRPSEQSLTTDSLLIAKSYEKWGRQCAEFLVGDFAFAIWDKEQRSLYCAKDQVGVRQLFYYDSPHFLVFSSEIPAIAQLDFISPRIDLDSLTHYLISLENAGDRAKSTFIKDVLRLMPAHWLNWENQKLHTQLYWKPTPTQQIKFQDEREYGDALRELIQRAVDDRMRTNYPVGVTLSGGLDSSSVACVAARSLARKGRPLYSTSSVLPLHHGGVENDERQYIELVLAQEKNIIPKFVTAEGIGAFDGLTEVFEKTYEPVNPFYYMDDALSQSLAPQVRVVLDGFLGDYTVSNYGNFVIPALIKKWRFSTAWEVLQSRKTTTQKTLRSLAVRHAILPILPPTLHRLLKKIKGTSAVNQFKISESAVSTSLLKEEQGVLLHKNYRESQADYRHNIWDISYIAIPGETSLNYHHNQEVAHPFGDKRIIEFLWASTPEQFVYRGLPRGYIRRAMEGILPERILWRNDKGEFSPDFHRRIIHETPELSKFLESQVNGQLNGYVDIERVLRALKGIRAGWEQQNYEVITLIHTGIQTLRYLEWLNAKNTIG